MRDVAAIRHHPATTVATTATRARSQQTAPSAGRIDDVEDGIVRFAPDLDESLDFGDEVAAKFVKRVDAHIRENAIDSPTDGPAPRFPQPVATESLDLREAGAILWATGFRPDCSWIDAPVTVEGWPVHKRGVSPRHGLYFVGLPWLHTRKSAILLGVGEDAEHVTDQLKQKNK